MTLNGDQKATIIENDPVATTKLVQLLDAVKHGALSAEKAARLRMNVEGLAIQRWKDRVRRDGTPIRIAARQLVSA
jgi:hypothetical protein